MSDDHWVWFGLGTLTGCIGTMAAVLPSLFKSSSAPLPSPSLTTTSRPATFVEGEVFLPSEEELAKIELAPLSDLEKKILRESGHKDLVEMASDDPVVARAATLRRLRAYMRPRPPT